MQEYRIKAFDSVLALRLIGSADELISYAKSVEAYLSAARGLDSKLRDMALDMALIAWDAERGSASQTYSVQDTAATIVDKVLANAVVIESYLLDTYVAPVAAAPAQSPVLATNDARPAAVAVETSVSV